MALYESTEDVQRALGTMINYVDLNIEKPTQKQKRQFYKATEMLNKARHEFDILNDMKET